MSELQFLQLKIGTGFTLVLESYQNHRYKQ